MGAIFKLSAGEKDEENLLFTVTEEVVFSLKL